MTIKGIKMAIKRFYRWLIMSFVLIGQQERAGGFEIRTQEIRTTQKQQCYES